MDWSVILQQHPYLPISASVALILATCLYYWSSSKSKDVKAEEVTETKGEREQRLNEIAMCAAKLDAFNGQTITNPLLNTAKYYSQLVKNDSMLVNVPSDLEDDEKALFGELTADDITVDTNDSITSSNLGSEGHQELSENEEELDSTDSLKNNTRDTVYSSQQPTDVDSTVRCIISKTIFEALIETGEEVTIHMQLQDNIADTNEDELAQGDAILQAEKCNTKPTSKRKLSKKMSMEEEEREKQIQQEQLRKVVEVMQSNPELFQTSSTEEEVNKQYTLYK